MFKSYRGALSNMAMLATLKRMRRSNLTTHGFRSTFRDWTAEATSYPREPCELALAHQMAQGAQAAYFRGDLFEKHRDLMQAWGQFWRGQRATTWCRCAPNFRPLPF
jgi:integrase